MADIDFTTSLNDKGFSVGLKSIEKQAAKSAKAVDSMFKMELLAKMGQGMSRLVSGAFAALAKQSADAAAALRELEQIQQTLMASIGRELLPVLQQALAGLKAVGSTVGDVWRAAIDSVAVGMRMIGGEDYQTALENVQSLRDSAAVNTQLDQQIAAARAAKFGGGGPGTGQPVVGKGDASSIMAAAQRDIESTLGEELQWEVELGRVEEERLKRHQELDKQMQGLSAAAREAAGEAQARQAIDEAALALGQKIGEAEAKRRSEAEKAAAEAERAQVLAVRAQQHAEKRLEIENMRLAGMGRQAEMAQRALEWAERMEEIQNNQLLGDQERANALERMLGIRKREGELLDQQAAREMERKLGLGGLGMSLGGEALANAGLADQVFGPAMSRADAGPSAQAAAATARNTARTADLLQEAIDRGTFATRGAVFA